jgi:uncharacterized protein YuzE
MTTAGLLSLSWQIIEKMVNFIKNPSLIIAEKNIGKFTYIDVGYKRNVVTLEIENNSKKIASRYVTILTFISTPEDINIPHLKGKFGLHWADEDYSYLTTGAKPIDIGPEGHRLDVVFTQGMQEIPGCWIATPAAMSHVRPFQNQFYLPPINYEVEIKLSCANGKGQKKKYKIHSPVDWEDLSMEEDC